MRYAVAVINNEIYAKDSRIPIGEAQLVGKDDNEYDYLFDEKSQAMLHMKVMQSRFPDITYILLHLDNHICQGD